MTDAHAAPTDPADLTRQILDMIDNGDKTRNAIAKELGIPGTKVSVIAKRHGRQFDASRTEAARQAKLIDVKRAQAEIASTLLVKAQDLLAELDAPHKTLPQYVSKTEHESGGWKSKTLDAPTISDKRALIQAATLAARTARDLLGSTTTGDVQSGVSMLRGLATGILEATEQTLAGGDDPTLEP